VRIIDLLEKDRFKYCRGTFHEINIHKYRKDIINYYENQDENFSIQSYSYTLFKTVTTEGILSRNTNYIVPIYQRPYSWKEEQVEQFINDIFTGFWGEDKPQPIFIGTMQLSERKYIDDKEYEQYIIDGQQRLSTFLVLFKVLKFRYNTELDLNLNWLETRVNNGEQDIYLKEFIERKNFPENKEIQNPYLKNALIINSFIDQVISDKVNDNDEKISFCIDDFIKYITEKIYFVVIETYAGLSKTIKIFNTINTTGLDLNCGDLFKIRIYEYLTDIKEKSEDVFNEISKIYELIDKKNKDLNKEITNIQDILGIYKDYLIAKYDMPNVLFQIGTETFFDRLFDTLLKVKDWENFKKLKEPNFELKDIEDIINVRFEWNDYKYISSENMFSLNLIWRSRYSQYWKLTYLLLLKQKDFDKEKRYKNLEILLILLNKIFFIYSIIYARSVSEIHTFIANITKQLMNEPFENVINQLIEKCKDCHRQWCSDILNSYISDNHKKKILICLLSAYLDERENNQNDKEKIKEIKDKLFYTQFDIEHIHANADNTKKIDDILQNSIGNLVLLEYNINREIQDAPFLNSEGKNKREEYKKSNYLSVQKISEKEKWEEDEIKQRRTKEVDKIMKYIYEEYL
ncbi:MAG: DUF262 domain-containing HNH endonuclease family protein, partial [Bacteroidales bacterium]|nr:DUF262 domain-containing HNH endonuclease family protein [Bacteroidales bacterium]